jgi:DNA-binding CsgD family transcriptional regulator
MTDTDVQKEIAGMSIEQQLLAHTVDTVAVLVDAPIAFGFTVDEHQTLDRTIVRAAQAADELRAAPLLERLPRLEPIDPFSPRRADAMGAAVMAAVEAGGQVRIAGSMYGRHLHRYGYAPPMFMYFRRAGRIEAGIALLRPIEATPFDVRTMQLLRDMHPFLERALTLRGPSGRAAVSPPREPAPAPEPLTTREAQVAALVADGCSNAAVSVALGMSEATVKTHLTHVYAKLGVRTRTQLAVMLPRTAPRAGAQPLAAA